MAKDLKDYVAMQDVANLVTALQLTQLASAHYDMINLKRELKQKVNSIKASLDYINSDFFSKHLSADLEEHYLDSNSGLLAVIHAYQDSDLKGKREEFVEYVKRFNKDVE